MQLHVVEAKILIITLMCDLKYILFMRINPKWTKFCDTRSVFSSFAKAGVGLIFQLSFGSTGFQAAVFAC